MAARRRGGGRGRGGSKAARDPHPHEEHRRLAAALGSGLPPLVVLRGEERWYRSRGLARVLDAARAADMDVCRHDANDPDYSAARLLDDLSTGALFGGARCVVLEGAERVVVDRARQASKPVREAMLARLKSGAEGTIVLGADKLRADHALVKAAGDVGGLVIGCRRLWDSPPPWDPDPRKAELVQWLVSRASERKVSLGPDEAAYVVAATGNDLAALDEQLERISASGGAALREVVGWDVGASPFDVAEHLVLGDAGRAVAGLESLFSGGAAQRDGSRVLDVGGVTAQLAAAVSSKVREALAGARALEGGVDVRSAASAAGVKGPPQALQSFERRVKARRAADWSRMLEELATVERRARSSAGADATDFAHLALRWRIARAR